ncbi:MAG: DMT family transporter [Spirochaetales bacterium]|nr:DMT family transporter [Spirochaetales bacterium]
MIAHRRAASAGGLVILAAATWGTGGLFIRAAALPATAIAFFRLVVPTVVLGAWFVLRRRKISRRNMGTRLLASGLNAVRMYFFFLAFEYTSVATATVALYSWPIFAALFAKIILTETIGRRRATLLGLAFVGIPLLYIRGVAAGSVVFDRYEAIGISSMIFSAVLHALVVVLLKRASAGNSPFETTFFQNLVGAIVFAAIFLAGDLAVTTRQTVIGVSMGLFVGLGGFTLFFSGLHRLNAASAAILAYFEVVVAGILGTVVLGEPLSWNTVVGGCLICCSVIGAQLQLAREAESG